MTPTGTEESPTASDLAERLKAVIEERLRVAREASGDIWVTGRSQGYQFSRPGDVYAIAHDGTPARIAEGTRCGPDISAEQSSAHIALNDPADAILAGEWALEILDDHQRELKPGFWCDECSQAWPCTELRRMAKRYGVTE